MHTLELLLGVFSCMAAHALSFQVFHLFLLLFLEFLTETLVGAARSQILGELSLDWKRLNRLFLLREKIGHELLNCLNRVVVALLNKILSKFLVLVQLHSRKKFEVMKIVILFHYRSFLLFLARELPVLLALIRFIQLLAL